MTTDLPRQLPRVRASGLGIRGSRPGGGPVARLAHRVWPPLLAVALVLLVWETLVLVGWKPAYVLPAPATVGGELVTLLASPDFWTAITITMVRALVGFAVSLAIGTVLGIAVSRWAVLRNALGALLTGLQTMPSIAWFPLAILFFGISEQAILFVIVLGAAPSIANGLISGVDDVSPQLLRTAHVLGARGLGLYRWVVLPAALPAYLSGLKQGWAFAWRSLMAGELLVIIASRPSLGAQLSFFRELSNAPGLLATMVVILVIGMVVDGGFSAIADRVRSRRGLGAARL
jgi:NitT/TauT family transport system permease protein